MQAKQPNKDGFDQQFEDYAWSQMSTLLDQEMPVQEEKKRRWLLWLFLFLGLSVSGAIVYQVFQEEEQVRVEVKPPIAENELTIEQQKVIDEKVKSEKAESKKQKLEKGHQEPGTESQNDLVVRIEDLSRKDDNYPSNHNQIISNDIKQHPTKSNQLKQTPDAVNRQLSTVNHKENSNIIYSDSNNQPTNSNTQNTETELPITTPSTSKPQLLNQLPIVRSMNISPIEPITSATRSITTEPIVRKTSKWELAARLGGIATLDSETHPTLGTDAQYHFKPKWSVRSGASWIVRQGSSLFALTEADEASLDLEMIDTMGNNIRTPGTGSGSTEVYTSAFKDSIIRTDSPKYHFLRIPLSLEYRLSNRLAVFGGMEVLMPLSKKENSSDLANNVGVFVTTSNPNMDNSNSDSDNIFIRTSWQWHTGVHFRASERFSVDFSYHHILPKQSGKNHLEQYFELGLRYNIFSP